MADYSHLESHNQNCFSYNLSGLSSHHLIDKIMTVNKNKTSQSPELDHTLMAIRARMERTVGGGDRTTITSKVQRSQGWGGGGALGGVDESLTSHAAAARWAGGRAAAKCPFFSRGSISPEWGWGGSNWGGMGAGAKRPRGGAAGCWYKLLLLLTSPCVGTA